MRVIECILISLAVTGLALSGAVGMVLVVAELSSEHDYMPTPRPKRRRGKYVPLPSPA